VGQDGLAAVDKHQAPSVVDFSALSQSNTARSLDRYHPDLLVHLEAPNDLVFNGATPEVGAILARIREDYSRWRQARIFRSDYFGLVEPLPLPGESSSLEELPPLVGSTLPNFGVVSSI
jgi:hypothetical protein